MQGQGLRPFAAHTNPKFMRVSPHPPPQGVETWKPLVIFFSKKDFSLDIFFRQAWKDERLDHGLNKTMFLSNFVMDRIWMPDSYFVNAKHGSFHKVTTNNMMIMIMPGGLVKYNAR